MVKIKFFGILTPMMPQKDDDGYWKIDACGKTIGDVLALTSINDAGVKYSTFVNNERKPIDYVLRDGDTLTVVTLLAGG